MSIEIYDIVGDDDIDFVVDFVDDHDGSYHQLLLAIILIITTISMKVTTGWVSVVLLHLLRVLLIIDV